MNEMWSCLQTTARVNELLADELVLTERIELGLHLAACRSCRTYLGQLIATVEALRGLPGQPTVMRFEPFHQFGGGNS